MTRLVFAAFLIGWCVTASAQQLNKAIRAGTPEAARAIARSRRAMEESEQAAREAKNAAMWSQVKDADSFVKVASELRRKAVADLYAEREKARKEKSRGKAGRITQINKSIAEANDPTKLYVPEGMPADVKKRIQIESLQDSPVRTADVRTWKTKDGKSSDGAMLLYDAGKIRIKWVDGKESTLKLVDLSPADWDYVAQNAPAPRRRS